LWATLDLHGRLLAARAVVSRLRGSPRRPPPQGLGRKLIVAAGSVLCVAGLALGALWWRLSSGPLSLDFATPWLISAVQDRFGEHHRIEVGGTQLELTDEGRAAVRMRDIVVRDPDGTVVATAPKAEVGLSGLGLLTGHLQARRLSLIGAGMAVRVERDGQLTIFAGADQRPIATTPLVGGSARAGAADIASSPDSTRGTKDAAASSGPAESAPPTAPQPTAAEPPADVLTMLLGWLEGLDVLGLDGHGLSEIGLKNGSLVVDDTRTGKRWTFSDINLDVTRPKEGGIAFAVNSKGTDGPWSLTATITPRPNGRRAIEAVLRDLSPKDLMLALRVDDGTFEANMPLSAIVRAEIGPDGVPDSAEGRLLIGAGYFGSIKEADDRIVIDQAHAELRWDANKRQVTVPVEVIAGANRISATFTVDAPAQRGAPWQFRADRGAVMLATADHAREAPLVLDHMLLTGRVDPARRRIELDHGDVGGTAASLAFSGVLDFSGPEARLVSGVAGTRMSASALKRIWPVFIQTRVRRWVVDNIPGGTVERLDIATNAPISQLRSGGPPIADDGVSIDLVSSGVQLRPVERLALLVRDADLVLHVRGRHVTVAVGRGVGDLPSGRKLTATNVMFEVPDTFPKEPPARMRFKVDGPVDAVAELMSMDLFRDEFEIQLDPATSHGTFAANVTLGLPITHEMTQDKLTYGVEADFANFSADRMVHNLKVEASALHLSASPQGIDIKGDARIGGTPATVDYRVPIGGGDADLRAQATIDDGARSRFGMDLNGSLAGPIPLKVAGRIGAGDHDSRLTVEADLSQAKIVELLPGWNKPAGKPARATMVIVDKQRTTRFEDIVVDAPGVAVKGTVEIDNDGDITLANFPTFNLSDGDKATLKAERTPDGVLKVTMRGDVYDGRSFVKGAMSGAAPADKLKASTSDLDLDIKLGAVAGFNGEALRGVDLKLSRRAGQIRSFALSAKLGRDATLLGDLRGYPNGRNVIYLETNDAGALCRFTDTYPRIRGGQLWVAMDPPSADQAPQEGLLNVRQFAVRGEPTLARVAAGEMTRSDAGGGYVQEVEFTHLRVTFTRSPGKLTIRDGVVWGPAVGATIEGVLDYARDSVRMRGTFVPVYGLNNMFVHLPLLGPILGGENEGLLAVTYEVAGSPHAPELNINPMSTLALGPLRKLFEFRGADQVDPAPPQPLGR